MMDFARKVYEAREEGSDYRFFQLYQEGKDSLSPVDRALAAYCGRKTSFEDPDSIAGGWTRELEPGTSTLDSAGRALSPSDD